MDKYTARIRYIHRIVNAIVRKCFDNDCDIFEYMKKLGITYIEMREEYKPSIDFVIYKKHQNIIIELREHFDINKIMAFAYFVLYILLSKDGFDESKEYRFSVYIDHEYGNIQNELEIFYNEYMAYRLRLSRSHDIKLDINKNNKQRGI